jgi:peroxiredoxin
MTSTTVPAVGQLAPEFRLKGPTGQFISLSDYRGAQAVVLVFYPLAFTPICSHQLPELEKSREKIESAGGTVLGISVDSWQSNEVFARHLGVTFPLLSDFRREASRAYGVLDEAAYFSDRATFVVDREGRIAHVDVSENRAEMAQIPSVERVLEVLEGLRRKT